MRALQRTAADALRGEPRLAGAVVTERPKAAAPYVVVQVASPGSEETRLAASFADDAAHVIVTAVGSTVDQAGWWGDVVDEVMRPGRFGAILTIPDATCTPLRRLSVSVVPDDSVRPSVWQHIAVYATTVTPI